MIMVIVYHMRFATNADAVLCVPTIKNIVFNMKFIAFYTAQQFHTQHKIKKIKKRRNNNDNT